jgi:hypothetical protein
MKVARILKGKTVHPDVSLSIAPAQSRFYTMLAENGALADLIAAARAYSRVRLRPVHRHGPVSQFRRGFPAHLQPQF